MYSVPPHHPLAKKRLWVLRSIGIIQILSLVIIPLYIISWYMSVGLQTSDIQRRLWHPYIVSPMRWVDGGLVLTCLVVIIWIQWHRPTWRAVLGTTVLVVGIVWTIVSRIPPTH